MTKRHIANLADWAETRFALLCDEAGVVRNKSHQDRTGWDYLVEFEPEPIPGIPHDRQRGSTSARVQVKSKRAGSLRTELKLTNALRFCRQPEPCFVVMAWVPKGGYDPVYYAREFGEELMAAALRRAREADRDGVDALHRLRVPVAFDEEDDHSSDLLDWMRERCSVDPTAYAAHKAELNRSLGYDKQGAIGTVTFHASDAQALIEHSVGLSPNFEVSHVEVREQRFSIPARTPIIEGRPDWFSFQVQPRPASLKVQGENGHEAIFRGDFRSMNLPGLGDEFHRAVFAAPGIQATIKGMHTLKLKYEFAYAEPQTLPELRRRISFYLACRSAVTITLSVKGQRPIPLLPVDIPTQEDRWHDWFHEVLDLLHKVPRRGDKPNLSFDDLGTNSSDVERFVTGLADGEVGLEVNLFAGHGQINQVRCLVYYALLDCGDSAFAYIATRPCLSQECEGEVLRCRFGFPVVLEHSARRGDASRHADKLRRRFDVLLARAGKHTATLADGNWMLVGEGDAKLTD